MNADQKALILGKELLRQRLEMAVGPPIVMDSEEALVDALFKLFRNATKHAIAAILSAHGSTVTYLMSTRYALTKDD